MEDKNRTENKNKGLVDNHDGEIILNETGMSVNIGHLEEEPETDNSQEIENLPNKREGENFENGTSQVPYDITDRA